MSTSVLLIYPKRGLHQLTICAQCGSMMSSPDSDSYLLRIQTSQGVELFDHTTGRTYPYPKTCPQCQATDFVHRFPGADYLYTYLQTHLGVTPTRLYEYLAKAGTHAEEEQSTHLALFQTFSGTIDITTRVYDPSIDYTQYSHVVLALAEHIGASLDFAAEEEAVLQLYRLYTVLSDSQELLIDSSDPTSPIHRWLEIFAAHNPGSITDLLNQLLEDRKNYQLPPYQHLILLTIHDTKKEVSKQRLQEARSYIQKSAAELMLTLSPVYPAKMLRRRGMYTHHCTISTSRNHPNFAKVRELLDYVRSTFRAKVRMNPRHTL